MRKVLFLLLSLAGSVSLKAQMVNDWQGDNHMLRIPAHLTYSTTDIAAYVNQNFDSDARKLRAIYSWVSRNIRYDTDSANNINMGPDPEAKITAALRRRKGVCENYAAVFNDICRKAGLTSFIIDGYTKQNGFVDRTGHSWCAVLVDNTWQLFDPTWDAETGNMKWFAVDPAEMVATHMPFDPMWQLLENPIGHKQFYSGYVYPDKSQPFFNFKDSISAYLQMDSLQRFRATAYRIEKSGIYNTLVKHRHDFTKMHIEIIRQDNDVDLYNSAVSDLNASTTIYNNFVQFRNDQFLPAKSDQDMERLLNGIDSRLSAAHDKLNKIDKTEALFQFSTEEIRSRLNALAVRVKDQKDFLKLYLSTVAAKRHTLFYKQVTRSEK